MKKLFSLLLVVLMCFSLASCSQQSVGKEFDENEEVKDAVNSQIRANLIIMYGVTAQNITYNITELGNEEYIVKGNITIKDEYGNTGVRSYEAVVNYNANKDDYSVDLDILM